MVPSVPKIYFDNLSHVLRRHFASAEYSVDILVPYVQVDAADEILREVARETATSLVTTWKLADILAGASSLELYPYVKERNGFLFLNQRLHLKTYLVDRRIALTGSANTTKSGLGIAGAGNHETLVAVEAAAPAYLKFLENIKQSSVLVTDALYEKFLAALDGLARADLSVLELLQAELDRDLAVRDHFLISELPMTRTLEDLFEWQKHGTLAGLDEERRQNACHDMVNYGLADGGFDSEREFLEELKTRFFRHPFIDALCAFVDRPRRFGEIKAWVQNTCTNVPVPSRRDLTGNVQVLYEWLKTLGADRFRVRRPRHSELIEPR
jgi:hypothetical protein